MRPFRKDIHIHAEITGNRAIATRDRKQTGTVKVRTRLDMVGAQIHQFGDEDFG